MVTRREVLATGAAIAAGSVLFKNKEAVATGKGGNSAGGAPRDPTYSYMATLQQLNGTFLANTSLVSLSQIMIPDSETPPVWDADPDNPMDFPNFCELSGDPNTPSSLSITIEHDQSDIATGMYTFNYDTGNSTEYMAPEGIYSQTDGVGSLLITKVTQYIGGIRSINTLVTEDLTAEGKWVWNQYNGTWPPKYLSVSLEYLQSRPLEMGYAPNWDKEHDPMTVVLTRQQVNNQLPRYRIDPSNTNTYFNDAECVIVRPDRRCKVWSLTLQLKQVFPGAGWRSSPPQGAIIYPPLPAGTVLTLRRQSRPCEMPRGHYYGKTSPGICHAWVTASDQKPPLPLTPSTKPANP